MLRNRLMLVIGLIIIASMVLAACQPATETPPATTEATEAPATEVVPTEAPRTTRYGPWVDQVVFIGIDQAEAAVTQLQAGEIDVYAYSVNDPNLFETVKADPNLDYTVAFGSYNEMTFNPYGPTFIDGRLNPFSVAKIREAMNWLINRDYVAQEIFGGLATVKFTSLNSSFVDYARYVDTCRSLEAYYAYNVEKAQQIVAPEMEALGATLVDGKWNFNGAPVVLIAIIRTEDERLEVGDYVSAQLETIGFTVDRQYKTRSEASPIWVRSDPAEGQWHWYTGGWITTSISRDDATNFGYFYTSLGSTGPLWQAYVATEEFFALSERLWNNDFQSMDERGEMFARVLTLANENSNRVWIIDQVSFSPQVANLTVAYDLAGGVAGSQLWPYTIRFEGEEGGVVRWAQPGVLVEPWNPIAGSNWVYDQTPIRATQDWAVLADPYTGLAWPQRIESAAVVAQTGLPIAKTLDWISLEFTDTIAVPADAWADWDAANQVFITVGEKYPEGATALLKSTVTYPADMFETVKWHDGSNLSIGDFIMGMILTFDTAKPESAIFDEASVSTLDAFLAQFKGVKIVSTDPLVIETYRDLYALDAELNVVGWWPNYGFGTGAWHNLAVAYRAEAGSLLAFSADKADALTVEWMSFIGGPSLEILAAELAGAAAETFVPYAPTLGMYVNADEAAARYANLQAWYAARGHFWIGTGPFYLEAVYPVEGTLTLARNAEYLDLADEWDRFGAPKISVVEIDGPGQVTIGSEVAFDVFVSYEGEAYPGAEIAGVKFLLYNASGALVIVGEAVYVADGQYLITLPASITNQLVAGSSKLEVAVTSAVVSIPSFAAFEFVTVAP
ncbi:MAG: ABC transporter substrate-binding protein [Chloroflexota bacterium]